MRISEKEQELIKNRVLSADPDARIFVYGFRADDNKKGGDLDLIVISNKISFMDKLVLRGTISMDMDDLKVDLIVTADPQKDPFTAMVFKSAVQLV